MSDPSRIRLTTSLKTVYYAVHGIQVAEIYDSLVANGPTSGSETIGGGFAVGLTESEKSLEYVLSHTGRFICEIESADINLSMVVTLPRHSSPSRLSPETLARWRAFEKDVAAHEQRHVDIHMSKMEEFERDLGNVTAFDCDSLEETLTWRWESSNSFDGLAQATFHVSELLTKPGLSWPSGRIRTPVIRCCAGPEPTPDFSGLEPTR